jgi:hypothetical protein
MNLHHGRNAADQTAPHGTHAEEQTAHPAYRWLTRGVAKIRDSQPARRPRPWDAGRAAAQPGSARRAGYGFSLNPTANPVGSQGEETRRGELILATSGRAKGVHIIRGIEDEPIPAAFTGLFGEWLYTCERQTSTVMSTAFPNSLLPPRTST